MARRAGSAVAAFMTLLIWQTAPDAASADPSFPCAGSLNTTERTICSDESLAALDRIVAAAYKNKFDGLPVESADALDEVVSSLAIAQKAWLVHRNSCGADKGCIYKAYVVREAALTADNDTKSIPCRDVVGAKQASVYVRDCTAVATETHPACNAENSCELIIAHNIFRCVGLGDGAPNFCATYSSPRK